MLHGAAAVHLRTALLLAALLPLVGWADPDAELAFAYVMNQMKFGLTGDERSAGLVHTVYACMR